MQIPQSLFFYLLTLLLLLTHCSQPPHDTQKPGQPIQFKLRVGQSLNLTLPYAFKNIWSISIPEARSKVNASVTREICSITQPEIRLDEIDSYMFAQWRKHSQILVKFSELQKRQIALDMIVMQDRIYVAFASGNVKVFEVTKANEKGEESLVLVATLAIPGVDKENRLAEGYFVEVGREKGEPTLMFFNKDYAFRVAEKEVTKVDGYKSNQNYQSVEYLPSYGMIAVAQGPSGLTTYTYNPNTSTLTPNLTVTQTFFNRKVDISDVAGHGNQVFLLDRLSGVYRIALHRDNIGTTQPQFLRTDCENLVISSDFAYVTCPEIHEIDINQNKTREFKDEMFHVRNLVAEEGMVIATGDNLIKIYVEGNVVGFYESMRMDRLRLDGKRMFIVSETNLMYVNWFVEKPSITCGLKSKGNQLIEGQLSSTVSLIAKCDPSYFSTLNLDFDQSLTNSNCLYHFPLKIDFWQGRQINFLPFKIIGIVLLVLLMAILIGWFVIRRQFSLVNAAILKYSMVGGGENNKGGVAYTNMAEEREDNAGGEVEMGEKMGKGPSQQQFTGKDSVEHHEIGE